MLTSDQQLAILAKVSTSRILALAADIDALDRTVGCGELEQACERMAAQLHAAGAHQVELKSYPCGREHRAFGWSRERRPYTAEAELWLLQPDGGETLLCRRSDNPASVMGALRSTPPEGETFEVADVGFGTRPTDYRGHRMPGKVALASGHQFQAAMLEALANRQAEGLLCGPGTAGADPTHVVPNRLGDPALFGSHRPFGFNLNAHQFNLLGNLLASGAEVKVRVRTRVAPDSGTLPVVTALLEGGELVEQRVLLVADLSRAIAPLAAACLQEIMCTVAGLVADGGLPPLRRSLQVVLAPGAYGTVAWLDEHREELSRFQAALYLELPSAEAASRIEVQSPPPIRPSFVADLVHEHLRWASGVPGSYRGDVPVDVCSVPYVATPQLQPFVDRDVGVTAVGVIGTGRPRPAGVHGPLHRLTAALAWAAVDLCSLDADRDLARLLAQSQLRGCRRLGRRAEQLADRIRLELNDEGSASRVGRHLLWLVQSSLAEGLRREQQTLKSGGDYHDGPGQQALNLAEASAWLEQVRDNLAQALLARVTAAVGPRARLVPRRRRLSALERRAGSVLVHRRFSGPLPLPALFREVRAADRAWLAHNAGVLAAQPVGDPLVQWVDGQRTLLEIYDQLCLDHPQADLKLLWRYLEVLEGAGLVQLEEISRVFAAGDEQD